MCVQLCSLSCWSPSSWVLCLCLAKGEYHQLCTLIKPQPDGQHTLLHCAQHSVLSLGWQFCAYASIVYGNTLLSRSVSQFIIGFSSLVSLPWMHKFTCEDFKLHLQLTKHTLRKAANSLYSSYMFDLAITYFIQACSRVRDAALCRIRRLTSQPRHESHGIMTYRNLSLNRSC